MEGIVYLITNSFNDKKYVGSTSKTLQERMKTHINNMKTSRYSQFPLYQDITTLGVSAFTIEPIINIKYFDIKELKMVEDAYISIYDTINNGYNQRYNAFIFRNREKKRVYTANYRRANLDKINARRRELSRLKREKQS